MVLAIKRNKYIDDEFIEWLINEIRYEISTTINEKKLDIFNEYVKENNLFEPVNNNSKFDVKQAINLSLNTLTYRKTNNVYIIEVGKNKLFPGYKVNLETVCKILDSGNTEIKGYPIFSKIFNNIKLNILEYYEKYLDE